MVFKEHPSVTKMSNVYPKCLEDVYVITIFRCFTLSVIVTQGVFLSKRGELPQGGVGFWMFAVILK